MVLKCMPLVLVIGFVGLVIGFVGLVIGFRICVMRTVVNRIGFKN